MKDQHQKISGYRDFDQSEIDQINKIKASGKELSVLIDELFSQESTDKRWISIGRTHLQEGIMALVRSVAKPEGF